MSDQKVSLTVLLLDIQKASLMADQKILQKEILSKLMKASLLADLKVLQMGMRMVITTV